MMGLLLVLMIFAAGVMGHISWDLAIGLTLVGGAMVASATLKARQAAKVGHPISPSEKTGSSK